MGRVGVVVGCKYASVETREVPDDLFDDDDDDDSDVTYALKARSCRSHRYSTYGVMLFVCRLVPNLGV